MQIVGNNKRNKFYSPILQNKTHIRAIKKVLKNIDDKDVYSIIAFSERCNINRANVSTKNTKVIKRNYLSSTIKNITNIKENVFDDEEVKSLYNELMKYTNICENIKQEHINNIKDKYAKN